MPEKPVPMQAKVVNVGSGSDEGVVMVMVGWWGSNGGGEVVVVRWVVVSEVQSR
jgi:hypothetical protein